MTAITEQPPDAAVTAADARASLVKDLCGLAARIAADTGFPLPDPVMSIRLNCTGRQRVAELAETAEALGVPVVRRDGMLVAERKFGTVTVEAHVLDEEQPQGSAP